MFVVDSEEKLCRLVTHLGKVCERRMLKLNVGKDKTMRCKTGEGESRMCVVLNGKALEEVDQFKYLESVVASNGGTEAEACHKVKVGCKVSGAMKGVVESRRGLGMNTKKMLREISDYIDCDVMVESGWE